MTDSESLPVESPQQRIDRLTSNPDKFLETLFNHVAAGQTLISLAETLDVPHWRITQWIMQDKHREYVWLQAEKFREEYFVEEIIQHVRDIAFADLRDAYDDNGNLKPINEMPTSIAKAIVGVDVTEDREGSITKIKLADRYKWIELLAKKYGVIKDKSMGPGVYLKLEDLVAKSFKKDEK